MTTVKANRLFLLLVLLSIGAEFLVVLFPGIAGIGIVGNVLLSEGIVVFPALLAVWLSGDQLRRLIPLKRVKVRTLLCSLLFGFLCLPVAALANVISQLWVDNTVLENGSDMLGISLWHLWLLSGVVAPVCEELLCRGILFGSYRRSGLRWKAVIASSLCFALLHMNFNQAAYAICIGVAMALLVEASGSVFCSMLVHMVINSTSVLEMGQMTQATLEELQEYQISSQDMYEVIGITSLIAGVAIALMAGLLYVIGRLENREGVEALFQKSRGRLVTPSFCIAILFALAFMILVEWMS